MSRLLGLGLRLAFLLAIVLAGWKTGHRLIALEIARRVPGIDGARDALGWDSENPEFFVRSARARQSQLAVFDLAGARSDWERALQLNPYYWGYWLEYGRHLEMAGEPAAAEHALLEAIRLSPRNGSYPWALANFFIRQNQSDKAVEPLRRALVLDDYYLIPAAQLLLSSQSSTETLETVWPDRPRAVWLLFSFLVDNWDRVEAVWGEGILEREWERLLASHPDGELTPEQLHLYFRNLVDRGRYQTARRRWSELRERSDGGDVRFLDGREFVWNSGFETLPGQGVFDWQIAETEPFEIRFARQEGVGNSTALRIRFRGRLNPEFSNLRQRLVLTPGRTYRLSFQARTRDVNKSAAFRWTLRDLGTGWEAQSRTFGRTEGWQEFDTIVQPPPGSEFFELSLRGLPSQRAIDRLDAVLWLDRVSLSPVAASTIAPETSSSDVP